MSDDIDDIPESDLPDSDLAGEEPDLDDDIEADLDLEEDETAAPLGDNDEDGVGSPPEEIPSGTKPAKDDDDEEEEDDDEEDDEIEADLDTILKERLASDDEEDEDEEDEDGPAPAPTKVKSAAKAEDEIMCDGCFLLVKESQFDTRGPDPACPHCGTPMNV